MTYCPLCASLLLLIRDPATSDLWQGCPDCGWMTPDDLSIPERSAS